jgi:membrane-bound lytic murein transglycosylase D
VLRTINTQSINYLDNFWDLYEKLPRETARYVPRFQATLHIVQNLKHYGLIDVRPESPMEFETVPVSRQFSIKSVADTTGILESTLKRLNPELRYGIIPGDNYPFKIPQGSSDILLSQLDDIPETNGLPKEAVEQEKAASSQEKMASHKIKRGETLASLAKQYQTSQQNIIQANKLKKSATIKPGMVLLIPTKAPAPPAKASPTLAPTLAKVSPTSAKGVSSSAKAGAAPAPVMTKKPEPVRVVTHVVKNGDSLFNIASRYGVTTKKIQEVNKLKSLNINVGQSLTISEPTKTAAAETGLKKYMVKKGENALSIASGHNMPVDRFLSINNLSSGSKIFPGQKVYVQ